ncbi:hypothetical protein ACFQ05_37760 [Amycolatopsis umgeniensis]|uniref:Uncharacterized protein n=1 Tax=Amycolatopsis umgeniensis TaxID=336628 RepID=A0A841AW98_9PSEU|nr:hypothetical protein [Amycolatopsis umgeniensis]MBB5851173.1 hypothetical protein [Amycolatopsis umgeniensis]
MPSSLGPRQPDFPQFRCPVTKIAIPRPTKHDAQDDHAPAADRVRELRVRRQIGGLAPIELVSGRSVGDTFGLQRRAVRAADDDRDPPVTAQVRDLAGVRLASNTSSPRSVTASVRYAAWGVPPGPSVDTTPVRCARTYSIISLWSIVPG